MDKHARVLDKPMPELKEYSVEQEREALQGRWDMFMSFKPKLRKALKIVVWTRSTTMDVIEAETVVTLQETTARRNGCIC